MLFYLFVEIFITNYCDALQQNREQAARHVFELFDLKGVILTNSFRFSNFKFCFGFGFLIME